MTSKTIPQLAAVLAGLGLVLSSFAMAFPAGAQTTTTTTTTTSSAMFTRDLTIGSTGADVTALQTWLIGKGFAIPAGATGYFGTQTQAAVAAYQAANGITPAAGYFGPITRAKVHTPMPAPAPVPPEDDEDEDEDEDEDTDRSEAREAIEDARDAIADAQDEVDDASDTDEAEDLLDEALEHLEKAETAFDDEDYEEVLGYTEEVQEFVDEALDEIDADDDDDNDDEDVVTSAKVSHEDGADNDFATFKITVDLEAFGDSLYVDQDADASFEYEIQDASGNAVAGSTSLDASVRSSARTDDDYYVVNEDDEESFVFTVVFDPLASDEGENYRLKLLGINFNDSADPPDQTWTARSSKGKYQTDYVYIND